MKEKMSTDRSNDAETGSSVGDDNECSISIAINSSSDVEDVGTAFALNEPEESSIEKNGVIPEESTREDDDQDNEKQDDNPSNPDKTKSSLTALLIELDQLASATPEEGTDASSNYYKYRDFSNVTEKDVLNEIDANPNRSTVTRNSRARPAGNQRFPLKLYTILAQKEFQDIIAWMPHGRSWKVLKPRLFESFVMPIFFQCGNYHTFNRLVNAWSFRRITNGIDSGSYYHELFLRGKPYLQKFMRRLPKSHKKPPMRTEDEPSFYLMDKENPLPQSHSNPLGFGPNHFANAYPFGMPPGPFGMVSGVAPMLIPIPVQMQMPMPVQWQPRYYAIPGATGWGSGGTNDAHDMGEVPFACGADGMVSQNNMHSIGMPMANASALSSTGPSTGLSTGVMNYTMGTGGMCGDDIEDGIETGMNINTGGEMGIGSTDSGQGAFDLDDPITKDGSIGL